MPLNRVPFYIVLLASVLPWAVAATGSKFVSYVPDILALAAFGVFTLRYPERVFRIHPLFALLLALVVFHVVFTKLTGRGMASGGTVSLVALTFIFSRLLESGAQPASVREIGRLISILYAVHILFIFAEYFIEWAGHGDFLFLMGNGSYRERLSGNFFWNGGRGRWGITYWTNGANSLLLGPQSASQLLAIGALWFAPLCRGQRFTRGMLPWIWIALAVLAFPLSMTMTSLIIIATMLFVAVFLLPNGNLNRGWVKVVLVALVVAMWKPLATMFAYKITSNPLTLDYYLKTFLDIPRKFPDLPLADKIMGHGALNEATTVLSSTDFGLMAVVYHAGLFLVVPLLAGFCILAYKVWQALRHGDYAVNGASRDWAGLLGASFLGALGWLVSLIHYTPAIELGGRHLFALLLAVCIVALKKVGGGVEETAAVQEAG